MPKVSVITTAYNHQDTIQRAIDSVNMQVDVDFEHIIIDDTYTHNGMLRTYQEALRRCTGEYITFCDADDYWIHEYKLKWQVAYMDRFPDCGLCTTLVFTEDGDDSLPVPVSADYINEHMSFDALLRGSAFIYAQSYMIRRNALEEHVDFSEFLKFNTWDYPIVLDLINHTRFHCMNFYSAVYVKNQESATNTRRRVRRLKYILGNYRIKLYFIRKYGCKFSTLVYLVYKFARSLISIVLKRWK